MTMDFSAVVDTRRATRVTTQVGCRPSGLVILEGDEEEVREKNFLTPQVCLDFANLSTGHPENFPPIRVLDFDWKWGLEMCRRRRRRRG